MYIIFNYFPEDFFVIFKQINKKYLILVFISLFIFHTFDTLRVIIIARSLKMKYPLWYGYAISLVNTFGATVTPAHLGGEFLPLYTLSRYGGNFYKILTIVTIKGLSGFFFYLIFLPLMLKALWKDLKQTKEFLLIIGSFFLFFGVVFLLYQVLFKKKVFFSKEIVVAIRRILFRYIITSKFFFKTQKRTFFLAIVLSLGLYLSFLSIGNFLLMAFNPSVDFLKFFYLQLPLLYAIFISPTPGGSGVGELGALPIFAPYLSKETLGIFVILWRIIGQYFSAFLGGLILIIFIWQDLRKRVKN